MKFIWSKIKIWIFRKYYYWQPKYKTMWVDDIPSQVKGKIIYILGGREHSSQAVMRCPRKCDKHIYLHISKQHSKRWDFMENEDGSISLSPSILVQDKCKCHYWFKNGKIIWCELPLCKL